MIQRQHRTSHESRPVVVLLDASGHLLWTYEGLFADELYREIKTRLGAANR